MSMQPVRLIRYLICLVLIFQSAELLADWREALPDAHQLGGGEMRVLGFSIYSAQLWGSHRTSGKPLETDVPFALELTYRRTISRDDLVAASMKEIRRLSSSSLNSTQMARWEEEMQKAFVDVRAGDRITGVYMPGEGARFYVGENLQYEVRDVAFAKAFFAIWFDPRTRNPELRAQLLGAANP